MSDERLLPFLQRYASTMLPMHMPGGKRRFASALPYGLDVTEVEGLDDLHHPRGVLQTLEHRASALWGTERSFVLVNGSTGGLLSAIRATGSGRILLARNCHRSVYNAAELCRREVSYVLPEAAAGTSLAGEIRPEAVERALAAARDITTVVITSPTYEGIISDVKGIAEVCKRYGAALIVDEAHGAHLAFFPELESPSGALSAAGYADITVQSLHKTLPALTQTALLHCREPFASAIRRENGVFETSSPSYILLASADECFAFLEERGKEEMARYAASLLAVRERLQGLAHLRLFDPRDGIYYDPGKLMVMTDRSGITGVELAGRLREEYAIETELSMPGWLLAMTSVCDDAGTLNRFADALLEIDGTLKSGTAAGSALQAAPYRFTLPEQVLPAHAAREEREKGMGTLLAPSQAVGKVALEAVWAYPPGVPLLVPGERVEKDLPETLATLIASGVSVRSSSDRLPLLTCL